MSIPDNTTKSVRDNIVTICARYGIVAQSRVTGAGTVTRYVDMPGRTVDRAAAAAEMITAAANMRSVNRGAEAMIYTMASEIVTQVRPPKKAAK